MSRSAFLVAFVLGPMLAFVLLPNVMFGFLTGEFYTNLIWGPVFGSGFWLADLAFWVPGGGGSRAIKYAGLLWTLLLIPLVLFFASSWLERKLGERGKKIALILLLISFLLDVPVRTLNAWGLRGFVLPDWALYTSNNE
jgi:hypothetical protein